MLLKIHYFFRFVALSLLSVTLANVMQADELVFLGEQIDLSQDYAQLLSPDKKGVVSWDAEHKVLTFRDTYIVSDADIVDAYIPGLIISVEGVNYLRSTKYSGMRLRASTTIKGGGSMIIESDAYYGVSCNAEAAIAIEGATALAVRGSYGALVGDYSTVSMRVDGSFINACATDPLGVSFGCFGTINLRNCLLVAPQEGKIQELYDAYSVSVDGENAYSEDVIIAPRNETYSLNIAPTTDGTLSVKEEQDITKVLAGSLLHIEVAPKDGYQLERLMAGDEDITLTRALIMRKDITLTAVFRPENVHKVTIADTEHGSVRIVEDVDPDKVPDGAILHLEVTPDEGYEVESIMAGSDDITDNLYFVVHSDVEVRALFKQLPVAAYEVQISVLGPGTVSVEGISDLTRVPDGTVLHFICTPRDENSFLKSLYANNEDITVDRSFEVLGGDVKVQAVFKSVESARNVEDFSSMTIAGTRDGIRIEGARPDLMVRLYDAQAHLVGLFATSLNGSLLIKRESLPKGCYILVVGQESTKVSL